MQKKRKSFECAETTIDCSYIYTHTHTQTFTTAICDKMNFVESCTRI